MDQRGHSTKLFPPRAVQSLISARQEPDDAAVGARRRRLAVRPPGPGGGRRVRGAWARRCRPRTRWTSTTCCCIRSRCSGSIPTGCALSGASFTFVLVDEFQDTNRAQYELIRLLGAHGNVCAVGDDDQSIYGWRGADVRNMQEFLKDFPGARLVRLEENYRSTQVVLDAANGVIAENTGRIGKTLTHPAPGRRIGDAPRRRRRARRGRVGRPRAAASERRRRLELRRHGGALPHQLAVARAGRGVPPGRGAVPAGRRDQLLRAARGEGPAGLSPADRQSARRRGLPPRGRGAAPRARRDQPRDPRPDGAPAGASRCSTTARGRRSDHRPAAQRARSVPQLRGVDRRAGRSGPAAWRRPRCWSS